jgi:hypothetical protein
MTKARFVPALLAFSMIVACGPTRTRTASSPSRDPNLITRDEIVSVMSDHPTAYDVIRALRPSYLRTRGSSTMGLSAEPVLVVYLDMIKVDGTSTANLKRIPSAQIRTIQYLNSIDATTRFGTDHGAGAILISTRGPVE